MEDPSFAIGLHSSSPHPVFTTENSPCLFRLPQPRAEAPSLTRQPVWQFPRKPAVMRSAGPRRLCSPAPCSSCPEG